MEKSGAQSILSITYTFSVRSRGKLAKMDSELNHTDGKSGRQVDGRRGGLRGKLHLVQILNLLRLRFGQAAAMIDLKRRAGPSKQRVPRRSITQPEVNFVRKAHKVARPT